MKPELVHVDIKTLRDRARQHNESGAVTPGYKADRVAARWQVNSAQEAARWS